MEAVLFFVLLAVVTLLAVIACYLLARILRIYMRARRLEKMRGYETIIYAALERIGPELILQTLLAKHNTRALEEVLLRMGDEAEEKWKGKVSELYELSGFTQKRIRLLSSRLESRRSDAARRLGRIGDRRSAPGLVELMADPSEEVREAARSALKRMGEEPDATTPAG